MIATATDPLALARAAAALDLVEHGGHAGRGGRPAAHAHRDCGRPEDRRARPVREPAAAPDRLQAAQHGAARRGGAQGPARLRVRGARRRHRRDPPLRDRARGVRAARPGVHRAGAAREPGRARGGRRRHAPQADRDLRPPRRSALTHDGVRRHRLDRGDGAGRARPRLRVPGDHRPLGELRVRRRGLARSAARADRPDPRDRDRRDRAARRLGGQHPARRLARLPGRAAGRARLGDRARCTPRSGCPRTR